MHRYHFSQSNLNWGWRWKTAPVRVTHFQQLKAERCSETSHCWWSEVYQHKPRVKLPLVWTGEGEEARSPLPGLSPVTDLTDLLQVWPVDCWGPPLNPTCCPSWQGMTVRWTSLFWAARHFCRAVNCSEHWTRQPERPCNIPWPVLFKTASVSKYIFASRQFLIPIHFYRILLRYWTCPRYQIVAFWSYSLYYSY